MKLESYITMMDAFLKRHLAMTMNHGVQQEHLVLWKEGKNTETYVIILNILTISHNIANVFQGSKYV